LDVWFSLVRISRRRWEPKRALEGKTTVHTRQLKSLEVEGGAQGLEKDIKG
jgi:hypothetical protein